MKKIIAFLLVYICVGFMVGCDNKLIEGSEKTYTGTVVDRAMSPVNEGDWFGRSYITLLADDETHCFWLREDCENPARIGDRVIIESAVEEYSNLLVAISITVIE
ncbi:MAG: hypothetical protein J6C42_01770 [Clostridia bacterium]|nr:hypothetical protein [Clostridia bacterium]